MCFQVGLDIKIFRMNRLGIPQDRIAERLGMIQRTIHNHLEKMAALPKLLNADLARGFTVAQVAQKHGWIDLMVWSLALELQILRAYKTEGNKSSQKNNQ